jgi:hypothetical protein
MKRRKKYNPNKNLQLVTQSVLSNTLIVWHTFGDELCELYHRSGKKIEVNREIQFAIAEFRFKWNVFIASFGKDQFGTIYMKSKKHC